MRRERWSGPTACATSEELTFPLQSLRRDSGTQFSRAAMSPWRKFVNALGNSGASRVRAQSTLERAVVGL